jgi:hypothetical protein
MLSTPSRKLATALIGAAIAGTAVVPSAFAKPIDASGVLQDDRTYRDLVSPDARDGERAPGQAQDLRPPDVVDAAQDYRPVLGPQASAAVPSASSGRFDWVSASIGAAAGTGLLLVALAAAFGMRTVGRRRHGALHA